MAGEPGDAFVKTTVTHTVCVGGAQTWAIKDDEAMKVQGKTFIKLVPHSNPFVKLVVEGIVPFSEFKGSFDRNKTNEKDVRASLAHCVGYRKLLELRNQAQVAELSQTPDKGLFSIFTSGQRQGEPLDLRKGKSKAAEAPETLMVTIPLEDGAETVEMLPPTKSSSDIHVALNASHLSACVRFIRQHPLSVDLLKQKRPYTKF